MKDDTAVIVRPTSDRDVREYHVVGPLICELPYAEFSRPLWGSEENFSDLGDIGEELARQLMDSDRAEEIERISFRPQSFRVSRNPSASWNKVEKMTIIPALEQALSVTDLTVKKYSDVKFRQLARA